MNIEEPRRRINASMLAASHGQGVTLLGRAHAPSNDGMSFMLTASDGKDVQIVLSQPLQEYIEGVVEVHGVVTPQNTIDCHNYLIFPDCGQSFDAESYNRAVQLANQLPDYYIQRPAMSS